MIKTVKYQCGKLTSKETDETPQNKICVDLIGTYIIRRKGGKYNLNLKSITMIDPVIG